MGEAINLIPHESLIGHLLSTDYVPDIMVDTRNTKSTRRRRRRGMGKSRRKRWWRRRIALVSMALT